MTPRRWLFLALAGAALLLLAGRMVASIYVDYLWYASMDALPVWRARMTTTVATRLMAGVLASVFVFVNLYAVRHSVVSLVLPRRVGNLEIGEEVPGRYLVMVVAALSVLLGVLLSIDQGEWTNLYLAIGGIPFGESDPYFHHDIAFFVYWLPLERSLYVWALISTLLVAAVVVFFYALTPSLRWERGLLHVSTYVRRHLSVLGVLLLLLLAWSYRLGRYDLLFEGSGPDRAFTYADHRVSVPANLWLSVFTLSAAVLVGWAGWMGRIRAAFGAVTAVLVLSLLLRHLAPPLARRFAEQTDPVARERPYLATRMGFTRRAYATEEVRRLGASEQFTSLTEAARGTSVWDAAALVRAVERSRRTDVIGDDPGWGGSPAGLAAVLVEQPGPELGGRTEAPWSLTRALAIEVDSRGGVVRVESSGAPADDDTPVAPPLVYDDAAGYRVISDSLEAIPAVDIQSGRSILAHAWSLQNLRILFADVPQPRPAIVRRRDLRERLGALVPFFVQGETISPAIHGDSIYWIVNLYSASPDYPLSLRQRMGEAEYSYVHPAGAAFVEASTGRVIIVADSTADPIARSWQRSFPAMFKDASALPDGLVAQRPPAIDAARLQANAFVRYGSRREGAMDARLPGISGADSAVAEGSRETLLAIPSTGHWTTAWTTPTLSGDGALTGLFVALGGPRPATRWLAAERSAVRWTSVIDRLHAAVDTTIDAVDERRVVRGAIRAVAVAGSVVFLQTAYDWHPQAAPTVAATGVLAADTIAAARTFAAAVGAPSFSTPAGGSLEPEDFRSRVAAAYQAMRAALRANDLAAFGAAYDSLGALLERQAP